MSDRPCNYCIVERCKVRAAKAGLEVTVLPAPEHEEFALDPPGFDLFIHPPGITREQLAADRPDDGPGVYWVAWFWDIGDNCAC